LIFIAVQLVLFKVFICLLLPCCSYVTKGAVPTVFNEKQTFVLIDIILPGSLTLSIAPGPNTVCVFLHIWLFLAILSDVSTVNCSERCWVHFTVYAVAERISYDTSRRQCRFVHVFILSDS
jgi:hypothetical protein